MINQNLLWYITLTSLAVAMIVGVIWVHRVWSDIKGEAAESLTGPEDLLSPLHEAFVAGQMSEEEYLRIKQSVSRGIAGDHTPATPLRLKAQRPATKPSPPEASA